MEQVTQRRRVLFVAEAVTLAHVARAHALASYLDPARFEVHVAWDPRFNRVLGDMPFSFHAIRSLPTDVFLQRLSHGAPMHDVRTLRGYVKDDLAVIQKVVPDVLVGDFRLSLAASARLAGIPLVTIANAYWSPHGRQSFLFPEYDYPLSGVVGNTVARILFRMFRQVGFAAHTRPLNVVLKDHGLPGLGNDIRTMYTWGNYTAYADIPGLVQLHDLPGNHQYIGAVLWSAPGPLPDWWNELPANRPVVYATPGSSGGTDWLSLVFEALVDLPVTVIAATARHARVGHTPENVRVADFLPGTEAARRSSLVICNGGSPTTYQALAAGVPVLGIVSNNMDQHLNMQAVRERGAGEVLRARGVTAADIRRTVIRMLDTPGYRDSAATLAHAHKTCDVRDRFPAIVDEVLGNTKKAGSFSAPGSSHQVSGGR